MKIYGLHESGKNKTQIAAQLGISRGQVSYLLRRRPVSPKKKKRTSSRLKVDDVDQIISRGVLPLNRRKTFLELASGPVDILVLACG